MVCQKSFDVCLKSMFLSIALSLKGYSIGLLLDQEIKSTSLMLKDGAASLPLLFKRIVWLKIERKIFADANILYHLPQDVKKFFSVSGK